MGKTGLVYDPRYLEHDMGAGHPESPNRLRAIMQRLEQSGRRLELTKIEPREAEDEWITQMHKPAYLAMLNNHAPTHGRISLDPDTSMSPGSLTAAYLAAGGALAAVDAIMSRQVESCFLRGQAPGASCRSGARDGLLSLQQCGDRRALCAEALWTQRVLIVDWDVHHGNGTQHSFEARSHPCSSSVPINTRIILERDEPAERGRGAGEGFTINVPMEAGEGDEEYRAVFQKSWCRRPMRSNRNS